MIQNDPVVGDPQRMLMFYGCSMGILRLSLFLKKMELVPCRAARSCWCATRWKDEGEYLKWQKDSKWWGKAPVQSALNHFHHVGNYWRPNLRKEFIHVCPSLPLGLPHDSLQHPHWIDSETSQQTFGVYYPGILNLPEDVHVLYINQDWWSSIRSIQVWQIWQSNMATSGYIWTPDNSPFSSMMLPGTWQGVLPMLQHPLKRLAKIKP